MHSKILVSLLTALVLGATTVQADSCSDGIKACGSDASVSCSSYCTACADGQCGYYALPESNSCSSATPCVDLSNPDYSTPPGSNVQATTAPPPPPPPAPKGHGKGSGSSSSSSSSSACPRILHQMGLC